MIKTQRQADGRILVEFIGIDKREFSKRTDERQLTESTMLTLVIRRGLEYFETLIETEQK